MRDLLIKMWKRYRDVLLYLIFGGLTTAVNYAVYLPLYNLLGWSGTLSNVIAWVAAVLFAFVTNKPFVFQSHDWFPKVLLPELTKFVGCRVGSGILETAIIFVAVDWLQGNGNIWKLVTAVFVIVLNYIGSKWLVFQKK